MDTKIVYIDGVDWQHEVGETDAVVWPSKKSVLKGTPCADKCGVVKCEIKLLEWVHPQDLWGETETDKQKSIMAYEQKIAEHQKKILKLQQWIEREKQE
jgi:hypothetical protein